MKRKLALLLAMVMVFVSVPFTGLAEMQPAEEMNFAEFLPEAAAVEEAVAQEAAEAVAAEEADAITDVEASDLALAGEGQGGGQMKTYPDITATVATPSYSFGGENKTAKVAECRFDNWTGNSYLLEVAADSQVTVSFGDINPEPLANMKILYFPQGSHPIVYGYSGNDGTFTFTSEAEGRYYLLLFEGKFPWEGGGQQGGGSQGGENGKVKFTLEGKEPKVYDLADFNRGDVSIGRILDNFGIKENGKSVKDAYMDGSSNYGIQKTGVETWKIRPSDGGKSGKLNVRYQNANHEISVTQTGEQGNFSFVFSCGEKTVTYTESELNSDQGVSLGRLLDELEVRTGKNPDSIDDAWTDGEIPVRFGSMRMEEWLVRCGNQPGNGTLVIVYGDQTYRFSLQFEENQQGGKYITNANGVGGNYLKNINVNGNEVIYTFDRNEAENNGGNLPVEGGSPFIRTRVRAADGADQCEINDGHGNWTAQISNDGYISVDVTILHEGKFCEGLSTFTLTWKKNGATLTEEVVKIRLVSGGGGPQGGGNGKVKFTIEEKEPKTYDLQEFNQGNVSIGRILDNFGLKEDGKSVKDVYMDGPSNYGIQKTDTAIWKIRPLDSGTSGTVIARYQNTNHEISVTRSGEQGNFSFTFTFGSKWSSYTESELNSDQGVSVGRLLDGLGIRTGDNPDPIDDAWTNGECPVRFGSMRREEWCVRCNSDQPGSGTLVIVYGDQSGDQTYQFGLQFEENQQGGPGYEGPRGIYWTGRALHAELDGWDYGNSSWIADNDGNQPVKVEYDNERDLYDIQINVKPELWNRVYNNTDLSRGVRVKLYFKKPDDSVIGYRCDYRGGTEQGNDMMNSVLSLDPILFSNQHSSVQENAPAVNVMKEMLSSADEAVLVPIREEGLLGYAWFTAVSPKKQAHVFEGEGENVKNFELAHFTVSHVNAQEVSVKNDSVLDENYLYPDSDGTYASEGVLFGTDYQLGRLTYTLNADVVKGKAGGASYFKGKPVATKVSIPGAENVSIAPVKEGQTAPLTVEKSGNDWLLKAEVADDSGWNFGTRRTSEYRLTYKLGEREYRKLLTIEIVKRYDQIVYDEIGFHPVSYDRIIFDQSLTDSDRGFYLTRGADGEIVTKWSGKSVNMDQVNRQITVSVPADITGIKGYRIWTAEGNIGLRDGNKQEAIEIRDGRLKNMELRDIPENGQVSMRAFYLPQEFMVDGKRVYSLAGRSPAVNENSICFIDWVYEEGGQEKDRFEYYYWTTEAGHTDVTMPESIHKDSGSSEPMLYQVVLNGVTKNKDDYFLRVKYYGRSGNGYDYYKIDLVDKDGHVLDLKNGNAKVTVKFTYPDGTSKEKLTNINTFLTHFEDETYSVKDQEQIRFEEDGIYVDLDHFSPFMLTWEEPKEEPQPQPKSYTSAKTVTGVGTYSTFWQQSADGSWTVKDRSGRTVTNAWLCDDAVKANGQNVWYLLGTDGKMETAPLVQDATGNYYSLETSHNGFYGSLRYKNGNYDGIYMEFSQRHDGTFGRIINQSAIDALKEKYGVKQYGVDNSSCVATSAF